MFVSDLDGTLLNAEHECDRRIITCVQDVLNHDCEFVIATGRSVHGVKQCKELWNLPVPVVALNGAIILDKEKQTLFKRSIPPQIISELIAMLPDCHLEYETDEATLVMLSRDEYFKQFAAAWRIQPVLKTGGTELFERFFERHIFDCSAEMIAHSEILKINIMEQNSERINRIDSFLELLENQVMNAQFQNGIYELTARTVSKLSGLHKLLENYSIRRDEVAVFGDGGNDIEMLCGFPNSFAVENGCVEAKKAAAHIIKSNSKYGVITSILTLLHDNVLNG
jgi:Cof subfamily protein (haloacid dehalogenase superfamily)